MKHDLISQFCNDHAKIDNWINLKNNIIKGNFGSDQCKKYYVEIEKMNAPKKGEKKKYLILKIVW